MFNSSLDPVTYVRPPRLGVASGLSLSKMLLTKVPKRPGPGVILAAKALAASIAATESAWRSQGTSKVGRNARPADLRLDRAHAAVHGRLSNYEIFEPADPDRVRSMELLARLYPTGLVFLKLPWIEEHAQSELRMQIIEKESLRADLDRLVGKVFMTELAEAHADYGVVLGITEASEDEAPKVSMTEPLRAMLQALSDYALQVLAFAKLDPKHLEKAQRALAPIDAFREAASRRSSGGAEAQAAEGDDFELPAGAPAPDSPTPVVPEE